MPVLCEDNNVCYIYVPSKEELGSAGLTKRPTSVVMIEAKKGSEFQESFEEISKEVTELNQKLITK